MRRFEVWLDKGVPGMDPVTAIVELPNKASKGEIQAACSDVLDTLIENELDTGWRELPSDSGGDDHG